MKQRQRVAVFTLVALGHVLVGWLLAKAMRPPVFASDPVDEVVLYLEFLSPAFEEELEPEPEAGSPDPASSRPLAPPPVPARREPPAMQAIIPTSPPDPLGELDVAPERVAPERDPFHRPTAPTDGRFGRQTPAAPGHPQLPRIAGERSPGASVPGLRLRQRIGAKEVIGVAAALIGGGPDAPPDAPCGGRINADPVANGAFSPNWRRDYGCGDEKDGAGFTGKVELPPGSAR